MEKTFDQGRRFAVYGLQRRGRPLGRSLKSAKAIANFVKISGFVKCRIQPSTARGAHSWARAGESRQGCYATKDFFAGVRVEK